ncbi:MAG TPA: SPOR domain-containing protein [Peptococcaceae bacterium]|nr:SPOR domain-containing protein [Peptococcaceae bacterium]
MRKKNYLKVLITVFVVILGISGIGWFTWHLGQIFVGLVSAADAGEKQTAQNSSAILNLPQITFWTCQVGVYEDKQNADRLVESLRAKGWKAEMIKENPYIIAIGVFPAKEEAVLHSKALIKDGIEAWVREEVYPSLSYKVSGGNVKKTTFLLQTANALLGGKDINEVKAVLAGDKDFLLGDFSPTFQTLQSTLLAILDTNYQQTESNNQYYQDLLGLYREYQLLTTKFLTNNNT